jgi:uncharacterized membrane protein (DUF373 family)
MTGMDKPKNRLTDTFLSVLHWGIIGIEALVAVALTALAAGALAALAMQMWLAATTGTPLTHSEFQIILAEVLQVFVLVELFRVTIAYMKHENVIPTVLEAALVAVARKFIVFEGGDQYLMTALSLSALLLAVAIAWWLLAKSNACELDIEA